MEAELDYLEVGIPRKDLQSIQSDIGIELGGSFQCKWPFEHRVKVDRQAYKSPYSAHTARHLRSHCWTDNRGEHKRLVGFLEFQADSSTGHGGRWLGRGQSTDTCHTYMDPHTFLQDNGARRDSRSQTHIQLENQTEWELIFTTMLRECLNA